ncbi:tetratricopeptide repeat protein [Mesorhizobium sp. A623]
MRNVFAFLAVLLLLGVAPPALAGAPATPSAATAQKARLDKLFADLKRERNDKAAERIAGNIWREWTDSGSASINLMMQWSQKAMETQKFGVALDFLDQVVTLDPTYAEGWNRRATVHYMMKSYGKSMADIDRTLRLEPRHFGALSGLAQIMADTDHKQAALDAWQRVLAIYPMMRSAQEQVSTLSEELAGERI